MYYYAIRVPLSIVYVAFHIYFCKLCCHFQRVQNIFKLLLRDLFDTWLIYYCVVPFSNVLEFSNYY